MERWPLYAVKPIYSGHPLCIDVAFYTSFLCMHCIVVVAVVVVVAIVTLCLAVS